MNKRIISLLMALVMMLSLLPTPALIRPNEKPAALTQGAAGM